MAEADQEFSHLQKALDLLESIGSPDVRNHGISFSEKLASGIAWCIATINGVHHQFDIVSNETLVGGNKINVWKRIEEELRSIGCEFSLEFSLEASDAEQLNGEAVYSVVQWLANRIRLLPEDSKSQNHKKVTVLNELQRLRERFSKTDANHVVKKLMSRAKTLEDLERQESLFLCTCNAKRSELQDEIIELEEKLTSGHDYLSFIDGLDQSMSKSLEKLKSSKKVLASELRAILAFKSLLDDVPTQSELIQYERRFSELYTNIQGKLRQTRRHYATYNVLLEIKDLMLKETSLLNSISSQFQDAISSSTSQTKLVVSMQGILKGIQQKLDKVQLSYQEEQQACNALKEKYAAATAEQRRCYALLKAFQEECAKNERLRIQNSI